MGWWGISCTQKDIGQRVGPLVGHGLACRLLCMHVGIAVPQHALQALLSGVQLFDGSSDQQKRANAGMIDQKTGLIEPKLAPRGNSVRLWCAPGFCSVQWRSGDSRRLQCAKIYFRFAGPRGEALQEKSGTRSNTG
jgi:hypothetical protein